MKGLQLVVSDAAEAHRELTERGVQVSEVTEIAPADGGTFFGFEDPDGNSWAVQEKKAIERSMDWSLEVIVLPVSDIGTPFGLLGGATVVSPADEFRAAGLAKAPRRPPG